MGISISNSNPIQFASVILDDEFESLKENNPRQPIAPSAPTPPVIQSSPLIEKPACIRPTAACTISYSDWFNYQIQSEIYEYLDFYTENRDRLRLPAAMALGTATVFNLILRISSLLEVTLYGLYHLAIDSFTKKPLTYHWLTLIPSRIFNIFSLPVEVIGNTIFMVVSPKHFILQNSEYAKVDKIHFQNNTLDTSIHSVELTEALGKARRRLLSFQRNNDISND